MREYTGEYIIVMVARIVIIYDSIENDKLEALTVPTPNTSVHFYLCYALERAACGLIRNM